MDPAVVLEAIIWPAASDVAVPDVSVLAGFDELAVVEELKADCG